MTFKIKDFLGELAISNWKRTRAKVLLHEVDVRSTTGEEDLLGLSGARGVLKKSEIGQRSAQAETHVGYKCVRSGQLISNKMQAWNGVFGLSPYDGITSPDYAIYDFHGDVSPRFIEYLVRTPLYAADFLSRSNGIGTGFMRLNPDEFLSTEFWLPDVDTQQSIVMSLDRETARIENLIDKKARFIELLKEKRLADITKAISPKDGWTTYPFWTLVRGKSISGYADEQLLSVYLDRGVIPYSEGGGLVHKPAESLEKYQLVEPGDLVMNNQQAWRGSLGVSIHRGIVSPAYLIFELDRTKLEPAFANYMFRARIYVDRFMLASMSVGDIQRQVKWPHLRTVPVTIPPVEEQNSIVSLLDAEGRRIDTLIAKTDRSIELLKEKRSALITAAVTGKIDVRQAA
ncbi:restriction endonuclease subunit S [Microvirga guangxiensis]|uniref:Type I restriction enzyme, S subunit n=1 Tax=Microvirga guangxiensis TaxID=549386 RepID=A0A1G5F546_9HYPH|nr:restriction endonuclease subunit S [Microvirga guangxiensis]SCY34369.1 type I restriction enzyme, S subunit [Microvirga guangxiensis]